MSGGGTAASSLCGRHVGHHSSGPRPPKGSATPQMVIRRFGYSSSGAADPGQLTIHVSIAAGGERPLILSAPLGAEGPSVEIEGPDGVEVAAYGLPVKIISGRRGGQLVVGTTPLDFEIVVPPAAVCPGHSLAEAQKNSSGFGTGSSFLTVTVSDPAVARHRAAQSVDSSSDLVIASWPHNQAATFDGEASSGS